MNESGPLDLLSVDSRFPADVMKNFKIVNATMRGCLKKFTLGCWLDSTS